MQAGLQPPHPIPDGIPGMLLSALPDGWRLIGRCRFGTAGPVGPASGCHALAHPGIGLALVDVAPDATPNAEARLRRALGAANFWQAFPGTLPVWHDRIEIGAVRNLPGLMAEGFSTLPPLTVPGKEAWIEAARQALAVDAAWEVPGQPPRRSIVAPPPPVEDEQEDLLARSPVRRRGRWKVAGVAAGLALLAGLVWLGSVPLEAPAPPPVQIAAAVVPEAPRPVPAQPAPPLPQLERVVVALPVPAVVPPPPAAVAPRPVEPAVVAPEAPVEPLLEEVALVLPPPAPPPAPPLRRASAPPRIDPGCTRALYRYQQGLALTAAEAAHVRNGCATRR